VWNRYLFAFIAKLDLFNMETTSPFEVIVENARDLIWVYEEDATYSYVSRYFMEVLGYEAVNVIGHSAMQHVHPDDRVRLQSKFNQALHEGTSKGSVEHRIRCGNGEYIWIKSRLSVIDFKGKTCVLNIARELSEMAEDQRRIAESESSMRDAEFIAEMGSWRVNMETMENWWSPGNFNLYELLESSQTPGVDYVVNERLHKDDGPKVLEAMKDVVRTGKAKQLRLRVSCSDSNGDIRTKHVLTRIKPFLVDGKVQEVAGTNLDITELVEAQFKLEEQYLALIELNGSISKFAFKNAHELRGPLSAILGLINLMETTDSRPEYLQFLKKEALALDQVVRDINEVLLSEGKLKP